MDNSTKWIATWVDVQGRSREYRFTGSQSRGIARIDFQLKMVDKGETVPSVFALHEPSFNLDEQTLKLPVYDLKTSRRLE